MGDLSSLSVAHPLRRLASVLLSALLLAALVPGQPPALSQTGPGCESNADSLEPFGPTDISAVSGNRRMAAAFNRKGTVTVLKWPSPSYYDQIKYRTTDRSEPRMGALPNEGAFIGLGYKKGSGAWRFEWLRAWPSSQRFADDDGDEVVTTYRKRGEGLRVVVRDVVVHNQDALSRQVTVQRTRRSNVTNVRVVAFANFNPVFSKTRRSPTDDWCTEEDNDDGAAYDDQLDAIVHARSGTDASTGTPSGAALVMGFDGRSTGHHVGLDTYQTGSGEGSAYDDAEDAKLEGGDGATGQVDSALSDDLDLEERLRGTSTIYIAAAFTPDEAASALETMRRRNASQIRRGKAQWWERWLRSARLPKDAPRKVTRLAKRALISARQAADPGGLIVASVSTQPPHGLDWVRNGSYINHMLDVAGYHSLVRAHNVRYAGLQATSVSKPPGGETTPPGNWAQNYYADGVVGGPIPYEIDETGLGIWTLWDHYSFTGDRSYLLSVYEAIQRAAHYLSDNPPLGCRDPATGLQCSANEGDNAQMTRTLVGAQAVWLGLDSAVRAARELNTETSLLNAEKWAQRRDELKAAIDANYLDQECKCYTQDYETGGVNLWPVGLQPYGSAIANAQADVNWRHMARVLAGRERQGRLEARMLVGNAYAWARQPKKQLRVEAGLGWLADLATTTSTGLLGEAWRRDRSAGRVTALAAQPNVWHQAMFYLAAAKAYGTEAWKR
jgi:GH15 family glucan-1,4-alpha-glucosidase